MQHVTLENAGEYFCYGLSGTSSGHFLDVVTVDIYGKLQLGLLYNMHPYNKIISNSKKIIFIIVE